MASFLGQRPIHNPSFIQAGFTAITQPKSPAQCTLTVTPSTSKDFGKSASSHEQFDSPSFIATTGPEPKRARALLHDFKVQRASTEANHEEQEILFEHHQKLPEIRRRNRTIRPPTVRENLCKSVDLKNILVDFVQITKERDRRMLELLEEKAEGEGAFPL